MQWVLPGWESWLWDLAKMCVEKSNQVSCLNKARMHVNHATWPLLLVRVHVGSGFLSLLLRAGLQIGDMELSERWKQLMLVRDQVETRGCGMETGKLLKLKLFTRAV